MLLFLDIGGGEFFFILLAVLALFGSDKLPEMVRGMGKGLNYMRNASDQIKQQIKDQTDIQNPLSGLSDQLQDIKKDVSKGFDPDFIDVKVAEPSKNPTPDTPLDNAPDTDKNINTPNK